MEHIKYSSIENTYREKFIEMIKIEGKDGGEWVVTEKIHGGQLAFYYDVTELKASSRTTFLTPDIYFFNYEKVMEDNAYKIKEIYNILKKHRIDSMPYLSRQSVFIYLTTCRRKYPDKRSLFFVFMYEKGLSD